MQTTNAAAAVTSNQVKAAFAAAGLKVRVRDLGRNFRVCTLDESRMSTHDALITAVCVALGLTDVFGTFTRHCTQGYELFAYKPGVVVRVA